MEQNTTVTLEETAIQELASRLRGSLLRPGDAGYEQARQVYNAMIDKRSRADRALRGRGRRDRRSQLCPRAPADVGRARWRPQRPRPGHLRRRPGDRSLGHEGHPRRSRRRAPCGSKAAAPGARWTMPPMPSGWRRRAASSRPPASAG